MFRMLVCSMGIVAAAATASQLAGTDWPQWRGLNRDGVAVGASLPATWPSALAVVWCAKAGPGYSSPVVATGRVFFMERTGGEEVIRALDAEFGRELWRYASLVLAGERILILDSKGWLTVVAASAEAYREIASLKVSEKKTYAHLVVVGSRLYVRDSEEIMCFDTARTFR